MIKALLIDDEKHALDNLEELLEACEGAMVKVAGRARHAKEALEQVREQHFDLIFLDIDMPGMNGLMLADRLAGICPQSSIVFVTAYQMYAVDAFDLYALDYLLKPVQRARLQKTVNRFVAHHKAQLSLEASVNEPHTRLQIQGLSCFRLMGEEQPQLRWRTAKAKELVAYLLLNRGNAVTRQELLELLWPEMAGDNAISNLHASIYAIRKLFREKVPTISLQFVHEGYSLELNEASCDWLEWETRLFALPPISKACAEQHLHVSRAYSGDLFEAEGYVWAEQERERLRSLWQQHTLEVAAFCAASGMLLQAEQCCQRLMHSNPYLEPAYLILMKLYSARNQAGEALKLYQQLYDRLRQELGIAPSPEVVQWVYETLQV